MSRMTAIKRAHLTSKHLSPGRTKHTLLDEDGSRPFPPFTELVITRTDNDEEGFYLMHLCEGRFGTDTWHLTLDDALYQAAYEFEVEPEDWTDIDELY